MTCYSCPRIHGRWSLMCRNFAVSTKITLFGIYLLPYLYTILKDIFIRKRNNILWKYCLYLKYWPTPSSIQRGSREEMSGLSYWPTPSSIQRGSREDRVDSVFETSVGQLPRVSGKDPERKEWTQLLKRLFTCWPTPSCIRRGSIEE